VKQQLGRTYQDTLQSAQSIGISLNLDEIEKCLDQIKQTLKALRVIIENNASETARKLSEIKGVSKFQASVLCNAIEGKKFNTRDQLIAFFGLDVRVKSSGTWKGREKISKRGNSFYRMILFQLGWSLWRNNDEFKQYFERLKNQKGHHYYTCLIATARKFLRFFFAHYLKQ